MKIVVGCDHIVTDVKNKVVEYLKTKNIEVIDVGTYDNIRTHYPIYGKKIGEKVSNGEADYGIALCGTGVGITNSCSKVKGTRVVLARDVSTVKYARQELNANVLGFGGRVVGLGTIEDMIDTFLETEYVESKEKEELISKINCLSTYNGDDHYFDEFLEKWDKGQYHD